MQAPPYILVRGYLYVRADEEDTTVYAIPEGAIKIDIPDARQETEYSCGASCLLAIARYYGKAFTSEEDFFVKSTKLDPRIGAHPNQIADAARKLGLDAEYKDGMTEEELHTHLDQGHPVLITIQAYGRDYEKKEIDYDDRWSDGHWVIAIGYDDGGIFFEDPSMNAIRGYLSSGELKRRWHDTANHGKKTQGTGLVIWLEPPPEIPFYRAFAKRIP